MASQLTRALWRVYNRPNSPIPFAYGGNLPWDDAEFGRRMLAYHLSEDDNAATRVSAERSKQIDWLFDQLNLGPAQRLFDITCGPGLYAVEFAKRGLRVHGIDFSAVSISHAGELAAAKALQSACSFDIADIRTMAAQQHLFDAAILLYGQLAVMTSAEAQTVLATTAASLKQGATLCLEMLNPARVDRTHSTWWFTDDGGLWGDAPYLHLGERFWIADEEISAERYQIIHLETGQLDEIILCDQVYQPDRMTEMLEQAGFENIRIHLAWDNIGLYDQDEWIVYLADKS